MWDTGQVLSAKLPVRSSTEHFRTYRSPTVTQDVQHQKVRVAVVPLPKWSFESLRCSSTRNAIIGTIPRITHFLRIPHFRLNIKYSLRLNSTAGNWFRV
ncbi:hypothetical protein M378DRAFT_677196 [Amanita muscaria Koide BX008]|uniref:Uncharacterized protein n=1 Tax=Amanita muscaria (strain Koide BX008) TaxID=946122 RepID=A0A0C2SJI5_AMAMK|nr:hypothetical protein M378DRAFT_677196 [Amanita muscaria Koide BX008]